MAGRHDSVRCGLWDSFHPIRPYLQAARQDHNEIQLHPQTLLHHLYHIDIHPWDVVYRCYR